MVKGSKIKYSKSTLLRFKFGWSQWICIDYVFSKTCLFVARKTLLTLVTAFGGPVVWCKNANEVKAAGHKKDNGKELSQPPFQEKTKGQKAL